MGWTNDVELNKYIIYAILEHVVIRLVPEIKGKTPTELLAERGVDLTAGSDRTVASSEKETTADVNLDG